MAETTESVAVKEKTAEVEEEVKDKDKAEMEADVEAAVGVDKKEEDEKEKEKQEAAAATAAAAEEEEEEEDLYDSELPNRIIVGRNHPLSFYVDRARRVFRIEEEVHITGRGDNISTACKLVETLKRQKIASIIKISTGMNVEPYFNSYGDARWGQPTAVILFKLSRGEFGQFIADYQQRKIIEIFETNDEKREGILPIDKVVALQFDKKFKANTKQCEDAKAFLEKEVKDQTLDLPTFIKYTSILIHPLLKNRIFKDILKNEFNIEVSGGGQRNAANQDVNVGENR